MPRLRTGCYTANDMENTTKGGETEPKLESTRRCPETCSPKGGMQVVLPESCAAGKQLPCMGGELEAGKGRRAAWTGFMSPSHVGQQSPSVRVLTLSSQTQGQLCQVMGSVTGPQLCCCRRCPAPHTGETHKQRWGAPCSGCRLIGTAQGLIG